MQMVFRPYWIFGDNFIDFETAVLSCVVSRPFWEFNIAHIITKSYNIDPLKPHFYIVKLGFTGVYIIFRISAQKHRLWVLVRTASARRF